MQRSEAVSNAVVLAADAPTRLRERLAVPSGRAPRLAFVAGPGDVVGTFEHWMEGRHDARVPVLTYSAQFYSMVAALDADALVITESEREPRTANEQFRFVSVARDRSARHIAWHLAEQDYARRLVAAIEQWVPDATIVGGDLKPAAYRALARHARLFLTLHNTFWPKGVRPAGLHARIRQWALGRALSRASGAVCTSPECVRQLAALVGSVRQVEAEMPQVLATHLHPLRKREKARKLLFLGRIEVSKGIFD